MQKEVDIYIYPNDDGCKQILEFLKEQPNIRVKIRDLKEKPLNQRQVAELVRHLNLEHFFDTESKAYAKRKLNGNLPERAEAINLLAEDNDLLKKPIIISGRLMVIGPNINKVIDMLQLREDEPERTPYNNRLPIKK